MSDSRIGYAKRDTNEVFSEIEIRLDEPGNYTIDIKVAKEEPNLGFAEVNLFEHLFQQIYHHGLMSGYIKVDGKDIVHHSLEDGVAMPFGEALSKALGDRKGIVRFGSLYVPFEGSLALVSIDYSGRGYATLDFSDMYNKELEGMAQHVFETIAREAKFNLYGYAKHMGGIPNDHHKLEAFSKAFGRTLHNITRIYEPGKHIIPSTKGKID